MKFASINLSDNRLQGEDVEVMIKNINILTKKIDLSKNKIGKYSLVLYPHLTVLKSDLRVLNLEKTALGDNTAVELITYAKKSVSLESLNLSENNLTDAISSALIQTLDDHGTLKELYLRWNGLTDKFGKEFFGFFTQDTHVNRLPLKVLDLSYNCMGKGLKVIKDQPQRRGRGPVIPELSGSIKKFLDTNTKLVHLDFSSNKFRFEECIDIRDGLKDNYTIFGFHFQGNYGYVDSEGFLVVDEMVKDFSSEHHARKIDSVNRLDNYHQFYQQVEAADARNCCWICDGWIEMKFEYTKSKKFIFFNLTNMKELNQK